MSGQDDNKTRIDKGKPRRTVIWEYLKAIALALILAAVIRSSVVSAYVIPSGSMLHTLEIGDCIVVNKLHYGLRIPFTSRVVVQGEDFTRGEVIVFQRPGLEVDYVKRIIGLPGDSVTIVDKTVMINGRPLNEAYTIHIDPHVLSALIEQRDNFGPVIVPENHLFVLGDNRDLSFDSRYWGFVPFHLVKGKAAFRLWSIDLADLHVRWRRMFTRVH